MRTSRVSRDGIPGGYPDATSFSALCHSLSISFHFTSCILRALLFTPFPPRGWVTFHFLIFKSVTLIILWFGYFIGPFARREKNLVISCQYERQKDNRNREKNPPFFSNEIENQKKRRKRDETPLLVPALFCYSFFLHCSRPLFILFSVSSSHCSPSSSVYSFLLPFFLFALLQISWTFFSSFALWSKSTKNPDVSTGALASSFAWSFKPLARSLTPPCLLRSLARSTALTRLLAHFAHSLGKWLISCLFCLCFFLHFGP